MYICVRKYVDGVGKEWVVMLFVCTSVYLSMYVLG